ncbi:uncharacterized protein ACHE_70727A [Aspergillus chevalieri]|uniref:DUF7770 domain-containing protein n=1 Tax=Aspergillus chevalieri TaxID=182096 RepID=A0A7R7VX97_ASPCH|nr:uncharacterized protein ACHE_70727A [Aspergillus chevalieri]BCR91884.1 hypothetical protein ACHE_70727A [Aspergillus chevalieri]
MSQEKDILTICGGPNTQQNERPSKSPIAHFITSKHQPQILSSPVTRILAVAHEQQANTNPWCFYLQSSPNTSICLDYQPSYSVPSTNIQGGSKANLILSELPYLLPPDAQADFALEVVPGLTVVGVYDRLVEHGHHKYEFDSKGVGCRLLGHRADGCFAERESHHR